MNILEIKTILKQTYDLYIGQRLRYELKTIGGMWSMMWYNRQSRIKNINIIQTKNHNFA